jgi:hypothetical protein
MSKLTRTNAIIHAKANTDFSAYVGCIANLNSSNVVSLWDPEGDSPSCLIIYAEADSVTVVPLHGGLSGTVKVKLLAEVSAGHELYFAIQGQDQGFVDLLEETVAGDFFICALALESGVAGEMVEAVLFRPEAVTIV